MATVYVAIRALSRGVSVRLRLSWVGPVLAWVLAVWLGALASDALAVATVISTNTALLEGTHTYDELTLEHGCTLTVAGGSTLAVTGALRVWENSTLLLGGRGTSAQVAGQWVGAGVTVSAASVIVEAGSRISADAQGYTTGAGPGGGDVYTVGGSYGGRGTGVSVASYGSAAAPVDLGSAGGGAYGGWSTGGGAIRMSVSGALTLDGEITADGQSGGGNNAGAAGGSVWITTDTLAGAGLLTATGNQGLNAAGGGGRIAVYYRDGAAFTGFVAATAAAGGAPAEPGTLGFFDTSLPGTRLTLTEHYAFDQDAAPVLGGLTLTHGATLTLGGGSVLTVDGDLVLTDGASITAMARNRSVLFLDAWAGVGVILRARNLSVAAGCRISADGQGYTTSAGPAGGDNYNAGGSHGGPGGGNPAPLYGDAANPMDLGSGGGAAYGGWSAGGGAIRVYVTDTFTLDGDLTADGQSAGGNHAGGAGGSVFVNTSTLAGSGLITANGAQETYASGGGGRVAVYIGLAQTLPLANLRAWGGWQAVQPEGDGTVRISSTPLLLLTAPTGTLLHGTERVAWEGLALDAATHHVEVMVYDSQTLIGQGLPVIGSTEWDTTAVPDGAHELRLTFKDAAGQIVGELRRNVLVNNALGWHSGRVLADETWGADTIHIIDRDLRLGPGVRVTVAPGAIVKVVPRVAVTVEAGGVFDARGSAGASIVLTALSDDSAGGDTNYDGAASTPRAGDWVGVAVQGTGQFLANEFTDLRYTTTTHHGTLVASQAWLAVNLHRVTADVTVPDGVTLTINPGAVLKFEAGQSLLVNAGGRLSALGSLAEPIVFTSIRDDSAGGDTNGDGNASVPEAGDWPCLYLHGGQGDLDHALFNYAGGPTSGEGTIYAALRVDGGSRLTLVNSVIREPFWGGVWVGAGNVALSNCVLTGADRALSAFDGATVSVASSVLDANNVGLWWHGGVFQVTNSIISNSAQFGVPSGGAAVSVRYCDVWPLRAGDSFLPGADGNIAADPQFKDPARADYRLGYRSPCIDAGDGRVVPTADLSGAPRYDDPRTPDTGAPMPGPAGAVPDLGAYEFVETAVSAIDLTVGSVVGPAVATAGQTVTVRWTVTNLGSAAATGPWHDRVYLVREPDTAPVALLAAEVLVGQGVHLGPGQSTTLSAQVRVPGSTVTPHRWQVTTNGRGEIYEGANSANNTAVSAVRVALVVPHLALDGTAISGQFAAVGEAHWFSFTPEPGQDILLSLNLADPAGAVELYVGAGYVPSPQHFDSRQSEWNSAQVSALAVDTSAPTYYVLAYSRSLSGSSASFTLGAAVLGFQLASVSPPAVGNTGPVTLGLRGGRLTGAMTYEMVDPAGGARSATTVYVVDAAHVYATFDLTGAVPGSYSVRVNDAGNTVSLDGAIAVAAAAPGRFEVTVIMPAMARLGRVFTAYVEYANVGDADVLAPILYVRSRAGALFTRDLAGEPAVSEEEFLAAGVQGPAGILQPGQRVTVPLRVRAAPGTTQIDVTYIDAGNTTPMAWAYLADRLTSIAGDDPQLASVLTAMQTRIGTTWGDYAARLAANASLLPGTLGEAKDLNALLQVEYRKVKASLGSSISGTVTSSSLRRPLAGLRIGVSAVGDAANATVGHILNDGSFVLPKLDAGTYSLHVQGVDVVSTTPATIAVAAATPLTGVVVSVVPQSLVVGTVRDITGAFAAPGALVTVLSGASVVGAGVVDGLGNYQVAGLAPGTYTFVVTADGQAQTEQANVVVAPGNTTVGLTVAPQATISGVAILPDNTAPADLIVLASLVGSATPLSLFSAAGAEDGSFSLSGLPGGIYDLNFSAFAAGVNTASVAGIVVAAGGRVDVGTVHLQPLAKVGVAATAVAAARASAKGLTAAGTNEDSQYDPGSTEPLYSAPAPGGGNVATYLDSVWLSIAYTLFGFEYWDLWSTYLHSTSASHAAKRSYGAGSSIVEGSFASFGSGFRSYDLGEKDENDYVRHIRRAVIEGVQEMLRTGELTCDQVLANGGSEALALTPTNFPGLRYIDGGLRMNYLNLSGYPHVTLGEPILVGTEVSYNGAYNIPSNIAGGIGQAQPYTTPGSGDGQQYDDNRYWDGEVYVTLAGDGWVTIHYSVDWIVNDTVDFAPGDLGVGPQIYITVPMRLLEEAGRAFDVPFHVQYRDTRFDPQTFMLHQNPPACSDPDRPPKPGTPGAGGSTPSNESGDPNEMVGPAGFGPQGFVPALQVFPYTIHFENVPTASAPAQQVVVTDALDPDLDGSTFELVQIAFNDAVIDVPAGLQAYTTEVSVSSDPNPVQVTVTFDPANGRVTWDMMSADPLTGLLVEDPLAGFLPPNTAAPTGEGTVSFTVRPKPGLATGTRISNQASIVFDVNAPILTNTALNTLDAGAPVAWVTALPAVSPYPDVAVQWSGTDDPGGSGVVAYDVLVATDSGPFTVWLSRSPATSAVFAGERGHSYAFYAVAQDAVGHAEVQPEPLAETQTRVPLLPDDSDGDGLPDWFEAVIANANRHDALADFAAVQPWDDFDGDGAVNLHEYQVGSDPTDRLSLPAAVASAGEFQVVLGAAGVAGGAGWWDLSGVYSMAVAGQPLAMHLVHDSRGRLSGTATYTPAGGALVPLSVLGNVRGRAGGAVLARIVLRGSDAARTASANLAFSLTLDAGARQLGGSLFGSVTSGAASTPVAATVALAIPAPMDGTWGLAFQLAQNGRSLAGTALLTLSNGADYAFQVRGRVAGRTAVLDLAGAPADPPASGIGIRTTITPMVGQRAGLAAFAGTGYGQTLRR